MIHHLKFCQNFKYFIQKYFKTGGVTSKNTRCMGFYFSEKQKYN